MTRDSRKMELTGRSHREEEKKSGGNFVLALV
jgi:hypothetical protein